MIGSFTSHIDLPQLLVYAFFGFFAALTLYLRREDKREGYPLEEEGARGPNHAIVGYPAAPAPKTFPLIGGGTVTHPQHYDETHARGAARAAHPGAPLYPDDEPLIAGVGPGAWALRRDEPFQMLDGTPQVAPLRSASDYSIANLPMDPRGRRLSGLDMLDAGEIVDVWIDKASKIVRYLEVELYGGGGRRLAPIFYARIDPNESGVAIDCVKAAQLALAPTLKNPDVITAREEDRINAFFAGGYLYAMPAREALR